MWTDLYLKFADEAESIAVLYTKTPIKWDEEGEPIEWQTTPNYMNIDVLGVLYEKQEVVDPENPPEPVPYDGWFVNVRVVAGEDASPLEPFSIDPQPYPMRVWG
jgi:septum formation inhibitor-activating ATPase MinD